MKHHGISKPRGLNEEAALGRRFGEMFPDLPRLISNPSDLIKAGAPEGVMDEGFNDVKGETDTPLGFVFFGQFVDHDVTLDVTSGFDRVNDPAATRNFRTPALDLDCIYGSGPEASPHLYYQAPPEDERSEFQNIINGHHLLTLEDDLVRAPSAPEGNARRAALIGDPRNDENRVISQIQLQMHKFHNAVFNHLFEEEAKKLKTRKDVNTTEVFEQAQQLTRWHYQWIVVHEFLVHMVGKDLVEDILCNGKAFYHPEDEPYVPIEFAVAAYRFGHTMVTKTLNYNAANQNVELFGEELGNGFTVNNAGLPDWNNLFGKTAQPAAAVDILLQSDLLNLPFMSPSVPAEQRSLATRNLLRSQSFGLPSGQNVHAYMEDVLGEEIDIPEDTLCRLIDVNLNDSTPLWLYILAEGELSNGKTLGPVGGRIVAETLIGLLESDKSSFLGQNRSWLPTFNREGQKWNMEELIQFTTNNLDLNLPEEEEG